MRVIEARNAHQALCEGVRLLGNEGILRGSRDGQVQLAPCPVTTCYARPTERVVFHDSRDYNPAFVLYEALWMLAGRNDLKPLKRYVRTFDRFSDDGATLHGAYGHRWRQHFGRYNDIHRETEPFDQLAVIAETLRNNPDDRRCILQIWDAEVDLGRTGKDVPCNDTVAFQITADSKLDMTVFCRSNDIIMGTYYANAFHFGMLHEYMALWIGATIGVYRQVSVNYHAYLRDQKLVVGLPSNPLTVHSGDPYVAGAVRPFRMLDEFGNITELDDQIDNLLADADSDFSISPNDGPDRHAQPWTRSVWAVLYAHHLHRQKRTDEAIAVLVEGADTKIDIVASMVNWLGRRRGNSLEA